MSGNRRRRAALFIAAMLVVGFAVAPIGSAPAAAATDPPSDLPVIGCDQAAVRIQLTVSSALDPSCTYTAGIDIRASGVELDCRHALIQHDGPGLGILVVTGSATDLTDVLIHHCRVDGFTNSIHLLRDGFNHLAAGDEYVHRLDGVRIVDNVLTRSQDVGIYVNGYVTNTAIRRNLIFAAGSTGVYLDSGSRYGRVVDNDLYWNGYASNQPAGMVSEFSGIQFRTWGPGREGIAVDGSRDNLIAHNRLIANSAGGVFLYTNCGENVHVNPESWAEHRYGAEHNLVRNNVIEGGEVGVWVASRMGENVFTMDCSDVPYVTGPIQAITLDRAANNTVLQNAIVDTTYSVVVEDDGARVLQNLLVGHDPGQYAVIVGTPYRTSVLARPVTDTIVRDNVTVIPGNPNPYRWVDGLGRFEARRNAANGTRVGFCQAPSLPRGPFVMTWAFVVQDPAGPPAPKPDFAIPRLGAQPPCASN